MLGEDACTLVVSALSQHIQHEETALLGCIAVRCLAYNSINTDKLGGACVCVTEILSRFISSERVVSEACRTIGNLSFCDKNAVIFGVSGACEALLIAVQKHYRDPYVMEFAMYAVSMLAADDENNRRMGEAGACTVVLQALRAGGSRGAVEEAISAIGNMAFNSNNCQALGRSGACELILAALVEHIRCKDVFERACHTKICLCYSNEENDKLFKASDSTSYFIRSAKAILTRAKCEANEIKSVFKTLKKVEPLVGVDFMSKEVRQ